MVGNRHTVSSLYGIDGFIIAQKFGPLAAALLNSSLIQAVELDNFHTESSIHSSSVVIPALFALVWHGFASRNGLVSGIIASQSCTRAKEVLETPYGDFISTFGNGG